MPKDDVTDIEDKIDLALRAEERSKIYLLLSMLYYERPSGEFIKKLRSRDFIENLRVALSQGAERLTNALQEIEAFLVSRAAASEVMLIEELAVDFTRLFRGLKRGYGPPPPFESVYRGEGRIMGEWTSEVVKKYAKADFSIPDEAGVPPDYIGLELRFMAVLCQAEAGAWMKGESEMAAEFIEEEQRFLNEHPRVWMYDFCESMDKEARTGFYKGLAGLTRWFLDHDRPGESLGKSKFLESAR